MLAELVRTRGDQPTAASHSESAGDHEVSPAKVRSTENRSGELVAGRYRILRRLGRGGMASVWLALDNHLSRPVALKELPTSGEAAHVWGVALHEARAASMVSHPGVVQVYGVVVDQGREWIVMEALNGKTLSRTLRERGTLPEDRVIDIGVGLLQALECIHRAGLVHGDVKPGNVQLIDTGNPVLIDFGLAATPLRATPETPFVAGSPPYMAPEVIRSGVREGASDLFSLGASLYEAAMGCRPFVGATPVETAESVLHSEPALPLPGSAVGLVIEGLLVKDPRRRLDAEEARAQLQGIRANAVGGSSGRHAVSTTPANGHESPARSTIDKEPGRGLSHASPLIDIEC